MIAFKHGGSSHMYLVTFYREGFTAWIVFQAQRAFRQHLAADPHRSFVFGKNGGKRQIAEAIRLRRMRVFQPCRIGQRSAQHLVPAAYADELDRFGPHRLGNRSFEALLPDEPEISDRVFRAGQNDDVRLPQLGGSADETHGHA